VSDQSTFDVHGAHFGFELPCDEQYLQMFEQVISITASCFGLRGKQADEFVESIAVITGNVLRASGAMPLSRLPVDLSVLGGALAVRVKYYTGELDDNLTLQRMEQLLTIENKEDSNWDAMANSLEFSQVDGINCCAVVLPLPPNAQKAGD